LVLDIVNGDLMMIRASGLLFGPSCI